MRLIGDLSMSIRSQVNSMGKQRKLEIVLKGGMHEEEDEVVVVIVGGGMYGE